MKTIKQSEYNKLFDDYIKEQKFDGGDWDRWYSNHVIKFFKMTTEDTDIRPGFHVNEVGERVDEIL